MAKSFRTQQPEAAAKRRLARTDDGAIVLPRIVTRKPRPGDVHPISAPALRGVLRRETPVEYLNGLARIELRPRASNEVGAPFAFYLRDEKAIILYSLPMCWTWRERCSDSVLDGITRFYANVDEQESAMTVTWPAAEVLAMWFYVEVFAHELGHHYRNQYRIRRGSGRHRRHEEYVADLHSARFYDAFLAKLRSLRTRRA